MCVDWWMPSLEGAEMPCSPGDRGRKWCGVHGGVPTPSARGGDQPQCGGQGSHYPLLPGNGGVRGTVLLDGCFQRTRTWQIERHDRSIVLLIAPFVWLTKYDHTAIFEKGTCLLAFAAAAAVHLTSSTRRGSEQRISALLAKRGSVLEDLPLALTTTSKSRIVGVPSCLLTPFPIEATRQTRSVMSALSFR